MNFSATTITSTGTNYTYYPISISCSCTASTYIVPIYVQRGYVSGPKHWKEKQWDAFANLINNETGTGARVIGKMSKFYHRDADVIPMSEFKNKVLALACKDDVEKIEAFFKRNPL